MSIPASLLHQPEHTIVQRSREVQMGAVRLSTRQSHLPPAGTNAQKAGMRYENRIGDKLRKLTKHYGCEFHDHVWIEAGGRCYQPDFFLTFPSEAVILFEVKQTWVDTHSQLRFYKHLLTELGYRSILTCTICKNLTPQTPRGQIIHSFDNITEGAIWPIRA